MQPVDILILSNGPGELMTWVKPVVKALRSQLGEDRTQARISVVLSPCSNASGKEAAIAQAYPEVDRVQGAEHFFPFLLWGKTANNWDWRDRGVVLFLGGDQFFTVVIAKRLGYRTVIYAEWEARWHSWIDRFGVMNSKVGDRIPQKYAHKVTVVGDLMVEAQGSAGDPEQSKIQNPKPVLSEAEVSKIDLVGLLPGSKPHKLAIGVPFMLAIAEQIHRVRPQTRFVSVVAPPVDLPALANFADPQQNPVLPLVGGVAAELVVSNPNTAPYLKTASGLQVELHTQFPAYEQLSQCSLCLTTIGANTAELGALAVPMVVILPTQQLDAMRAWDGLPGLLANLPGVGSSFAKVINGLALRRIGLLAWPNIWAQEQIVPELVGKLQPSAVADLMLDLLDHPEKLQQMQEKLRQVRGQPGAAHKLAQLVQQLVRD
ncbi:MAG: lipid-A-disaccharide synthase [Leptolyngbyaceae bacterium]|nr:lipid-A-disaccharide synthase [Leptolyngbyaceae bacterium]